jgi:hypothetical protein
MATVRGEFVNGTLLKTYRLTFVGAASAIALVLAPFLPALRHAYVTLANTMAAASGPDVSAVFAPRTSTRQFVAYGYPWRAGHLGPQWDDQHIPLILAGPEIKSGGHSNYPARMVDIAPTIEHLFGAKTGRVDGIVLNNALRPQSAAGSATQRLCGAQLLPIIKAIQRRSGYR